MIFNKGFDRLLELLDRVMIASLDLLLAELGEPALHLIDPRTVGWGEVQVVAGPFGQPIAHERRLMGGLTNTTVSATDWDIWKGLLTVIATDVNSVTYSEHLPGATSELTLFIAKNKLGVDFDITKLAFDVCYEKMAQSSRA